MQLPLPATLASSAQRSRLGWSVIRLALAGLLAAHGWARWLAGGVPPFGQFLETQGLPAGLFFATAVTGIEIAGSLALALGRLVSPLCVVFAVIYTLGIALVHAKAGWFVVGLGRNGAEFSVLLIICLLATGLQHVRGSGEA